MLNSKHALAGGTWVTLVVALAAALLGCSSMATSTAPSTSTAASVATSPLVLEPSGLGVVGVGDEQSAAASTITRYLGAPSATRSGVCGDTTEVDWGDLSVEFTSGKLTGYRYLRGGLATMGTSPRPTGPGDPLLSTATGATLGMTLSEVRSLYPPGEFTLERGGEIVVPGTTGADRLILEFFGADPSTPMTEVKGGVPCGDF